MAEAVVIGAGHAGCESALALARTGHETVLITLNLESVALMPCNPSIGGTGKGHLVREVDALGGEMGLAIDDTTLQSRMLNTGKGPAVRSLRAQADKRAYQARMQSALFAQERLTIRQAEAKEIMVENGRVTGVKTTTGDLIPCRCAVVATGVYLKSRIIIGEAQWEGGPQGLLPASFLSESLTGLGFSLRRFKTGTPARIDGRTIDFDKMEAQEGDEPVTPFSFLTDRPILNKKQCYLTWTTQETHRLIEDNIARAPMYSGKIHGTGARYCPSIEDKVMRFRDKERHPVFIEPEGLTHPEWYAQGLSSSMPEDVQRAMYRTVPGLENAELSRLAYAIEYDCIDPTALTPALASRDIAGLYFAGQINGTSGYEEAAAQGILAGINASLYLRGDAPMIITRDEGYIGVLADDLTSKGADEPYRMMTSRVERRLSLRQDNADLRLTARAHAICLAGDERLRRADEKARLTTALLNQLSESGDIERVRRPGECLDPSALPFPPRVVEQAEIQIKYEGYLQKERALVQKARAMEEKRIPPDIDYSLVPSLRIEARQKLTARRPLSLGQASRIPGVSPADVAVLMVWMRKNEEA